MVRPIQLMIVGTQKAGTTSLFRYLAQHPEIHTHPQHEMCYFVHDFEFNKGYKKIFSKYFAGGAGGKGVLLAKHVMVIYSPDAVKRLYDHNPHIQLIVILRNPIDRAYSAYWFARLMGWERIKTFEKTIEVEPARLKEGWFRWRNCAYLYNSIYYQHLIKLFDQFEKNKIHAFLTEDLKENPLGMCQKIFRLFDIDPHFIPEIEVRYNRAAIARSEVFARTFAWFLHANNPIRRLFRRFIPETISYKMEYAFLRLNKKEFTPPPMNPDTRKLLVKYFEPHNARLSKLLGRDLNYWNR